MRLRHSLCRIERGLCSRRLETRLRLDLAKWLERLESLGLCDYFLILIFVDFDIAILVRILISLRCVIVLDAESLQIVVLFTYLIYEEIPVRLSKL